LFVTVGFVVSGSPPNLVGRDGSNVAIGTWIQMIGVLIALIAGVISRGPTTGRRLRVGDETAHGQGSRGLPSLQP
jgi:hypothetical protein